MYQAGPGTIVVCEWPFKRGLAINITKYKANLAIYIKNATLAVDNSKDTSTVAKNRRSFLIKNA